MNWTSFRSDFKVGWKKIKTNIQNSTLNLSFDALLKCNKSAHKVNIFWEGHQILRNLHLTLSYVVPVKSKMKISQNYVAFSEYMNFKRKVKLTLYMFVNQSVVNFTTHGLVYSNSKWLKSFHHTWSTHSNSLATFQTFWIYFPRFAGYTYNGKTDK
jgi:hypothetical protein